MTLDTFTTAHVPAVHTTAVPEAVATLRAWATTYAEVAQFVAPLVQTPFVPDAFKPKIDPRADEQTRREAYETAVASATAAVIYGAAIGFDPLTALQNVYVVGGRPGLYAAAMVAIVQAAGHEVWTEDITDSRAVVCGRRKGSKAVERVTVTIEGAKRAGWTRNPKYTSEPQPMLWARGVSTVCRRIGQDALKGIGASVEELQDGEPAQAAATRVVQRAPVSAPRLAAAPPPSGPQKAQPAPAGPPPLPGEDSPTPAAETPPTADPEPVDAETLARQGWDNINAAFRAAGITGTGQQARRLTALTRICGRQITRGSDLTVADTTLVLDTLEGMSRDAVRRLCDPNDVEDAPAVEETPVPASDPVTTPDRETETVYLPNDEQELDRRWEQGWPTGEAQQ